MKTNWSCGCKITVMIVPDTSPIPSFAPRQSLPPKLIPIPSITQQPIQSYITTPTIPDTPSPCHPDSTSLHLPPRCRCHLPVNDTVKNRSARPDHPIWWIAWPSGASTTFPTSLAIARATGQLVNVDLVLLQLLTNKQTHSLSISSMAYKYLPMPVRISTIYMSSANPLPQTENDFVVCCDVRHYYFPLTPPPR